MYQTRKDEKISICETLPCRKQLIKFGFWMATISFYDLIKTPDDESGVSESYYSFIFTSR